MLALVSVAVVLYDVLVLLLAVGLLLVPLLQAASELNDMIR
jgi:hypothetical protein